MNSISTMAVRDFILRFRPKTSDISQVVLGRIAIIGAMLLGVGAAYVVYRQPEGLYKYLQTISIYLLMPITPSIVFGIMSRRVTYAGAIASIGVGIMVSALYMTDALLGMMAPAKAERVFPFLHRTLTTNYTYRGLWGTLHCDNRPLHRLGIHEKNGPREIRKTSIDWSNWTRRIEPFQGLTDWRLHLAVLSALTILAYWRLW